MSCQLLEHEKRRAKPACRLAVLRMLVFIDIVAVRIVVEAAPVRVRRTRAFVRIVFVGIKIRLSETDKSIAIRIGVNVSIYVICPRIATVIRPCHRIRPSESSSERCGPRVAGTCLAHRPTCPDTTARPTERTLVMVAGRGNHALRGGADIVNEATGITRLDRESHRA